MRRITNRSFLAFAIMFLVYFSLVAENKFKKVEVKEKTEEKEKITKKAKREKPVDITSSSLDIDYKNGKAIFLGGVRVKDEGMILTAEKLIVYFGKENSIERIEAHEDVVITQKDKKAVAGKALYTLADGKIVISEKPILYQAYNKLVDAESIILYKDAETVSTKGGQPRLLFLPKKQGKTDE
ncbi:MAG: LptA/OstA family protein [Verrucomicrobiota bacterium]|nr:LptA/OstA family protein [Verrucomicrobiota bacterium]